MSEQRIPSAPLPATTDVLDRALRLVIQADRKYNHRGIFLVPFYKDWMNPTFPDLSNNERKWIIEELVQERAVAIRQKEDVFQRGRNYSILYPIRESQRYLRIKEEIEGEDRLSRSS